MLKSILVHLPGVKADGAVLAAALDLAKPFNAHLECLHVVPDAAALVPRQGEIEIETAVLIADALGQLEAEAKKRAAHARDAYMEFCRTNNIPVANSPPGPGAVSVSWHEAAGEPSDRLIALARVHDLVVTAGGGDGDTLIPTDTGQLIVGGGRPVLLVPKKARKISLKTVAIAWKDSPEAARAVTAAMPLLAKAHKIVVLSASEEESKVMECLECYESVVNQLRWHGLKTEGRYVVPAGRTVPDAILESAREADADLLVMGGYGHSRLREFVFGGFTRRVLQGTDIPVLIFH